MNKKGERETSTAYYNTERNGDGNRGTFCIPPYERNAGPILIALITLRIFLFMVEAVLCLNYKLGYYKRFFLYPTEVFFFEAVMLTQFYC